MAADEEVVTKNATYCIDWNVLGTLFVIYSKEHLFFEVRLSLIAEWNHQSYKGLEIHIWPSSIMAKDSQDLLKEGVELEFLQLADPCNIDRYIGGGDRCLI